MPFQFHRNAKQMLMLNIAGHQSHYSTGIWLVTCICWALVLTTAYQVCEIVHMLLPSKFCHNFRCFFCFEICFEIIIFVVDWLTCYLILLIYHLWLLLVMLKYYCTCKSFTVELCKLHFARAYYNSLYSKNERTSHFICMVWRRHDAHTFVRHQVHNSILEFAHQICLYACVIVISILLFMGRTNFWIFFFLNEQLQSLHFW